MPVPSGLSAQLGFAAETTHGTRVAPTKFMDLVSESLSLTIERMESAGLRAGRRMLTSNQWVAGRRSAGGDLVMELGTTGQGLLWQAALGGTASSTGAGPYVHTYAPGDINTSMTIQIGKPSIDGTVRVFEYPGSMVNTWEVSCSAGEIARVSLGILARDETTSQTLATATYPTGYAPMVFTQGVLNIGGSLYEVREATVSGDNGLVDDRFVLGSAYRNQPKEADKRDYSFSLTSDFFDLTAYNRFVNGTEAALTLTFTSGAYIFQIVGNVRTDGSTPVVSGPDILDLPLTGKFVASGATDDTGLKIVRTTTEVTATA